MTPENDVERGPIGRQGPDGKQGPVGKRGPHGDQGDAGGIDSSLSKELLDAVNRQNEVLEMVNKTIQEIQPEVKHAVKAAKRTARVLAAALALVVMAASFTLYQRQATINRARIDQCLAGNDARKVNHDTWKVTLDAVEQLAPADQKVGIEKVRAAQDEINVIRDCK